MRILGTGRSPQEREDLIDVICTVITVEERIVRVCVCTRVSESAIS